MSLQIKPVSVNNSKMAKAIKDVQSENLCKLTMNIPRSLRSELKIKAERNGTDMTNVVLSYIKQYVQQ
jgi:hypothetical protein